METEVVKYIGLGEWSDTDTDEYTLDVLCLMALADAFGFEYGEFV